MDSCSELSRKIDQLDRTIESHRRWDQDRGVCRHQDEIADFERARAQCVLFHNTKCTGQPLWIPEPRPEEALPFVLLIAVCAICPECCAIPILAL